MCIMSQRDLEDFPQIDVTPRFDVMPRYGVLLAKIKSATAEAFGVTVMDIESNRRQAHIMRPRQAYYWLATKLTHHSYAAIARMCGNRDHTTVMHGVKVAEVWRERDEAYRNILDTLMKRLERAA